jgi:hypothetical protein
MKFNSIDAREDVHYEMVHFPIDHIATGQFDSSGNQESTHPKLKGRRVGIFRSLLNGYNRGNGVFPHAKAWRSFLRFHGEEA